MSVSVTCSDCGKRLQAPDGALGKQVKCPACGSRVEVVDDIVDDLIVQDLDEGDELPAPGQHRKGKQEGMPLRPGRGARRARAKGAGPVDLTHARKAARHGRREDKRRDEGLPPRPGKAMRQMSPDERRRAARQARQYSSRRRSSRRSTRPPLGDQPVDLPGPADIERPSRSSKPVASGPAPTGVTTCRQCNSAMTPGAVICVNCGLNVSTGQCVGGFWGRRNPFNWKGLVGPLAGIAILLGVYWWVNENVLKPNARSAAAEPHRQNRRKKPTAKELFGSRGKLPDEKSQRPARKPAPAPPRKGAAADPPPPGSGPRKFGGSRAGIQCTYPESWIQVAPMRLNGPAALDRPNVAFNWLARSTFDAYREKTVSSLAALKFKEFKPGELEPFAHPAGKAKAFTVHYADAAARYTRRYVLIRIGSRTLQVQLSASRESWDRAETDFKTILDSLRAAE